jgi:hypothetical protein
MGPLQWGHYGLATSGACCPSGPPSKGRLSTATVQRSAASRPAAHEDTAEALRETMRFPEDDLLKSLVGDGPGLCLDAEGIEYVPNGCAMIRCISSASLILLSPCSGAGR